MRYLALLLRRFPYLTTELCYPKPYQLGGMAEWLNAAVLKTVVPQGTVGSNPTSSAKLIAPFSERRFLILNAMALRGRVGSNYGSFKKLYRCCSILRTELQGKKLTATTHSTQRTARRFRRTRSINHAREARRGALRRLSLRFFGRSSALPESAFKELHFN